MEYEIDVKERNTKESVRSLRREGKIPGVIYGHNEGTRHILVDEVALKKLITNLHSESTMINVHYGKEIMECVLKDVQRDILTDRIIHIDFYHLHRGEKITVAIPIVLEGDAKGIKEGGVLDFVTREIEVECLPKDIINEIKVDVSNVDIGDTIHISDINIDRKKYRIFAESSEPVLSIIMPRAPVVEEVVEEEEAAEPELVGEEEKKEEEKSEKGA